MEITLFITSDSGDSSILKAKCQIPNWNLLGSMCTNNILGLCLSYHHEELASTLHTSLLRIFSVCHQHGHSEHQLLLYRWATDRDEG